MPIKPRIAISTGCGQTNERIDQAQLSYLYIRSVVAAGGAPLLLPPGEDPELIAACLPAADGLILPGGPDLDPALYGEAPHPLYEPVTGPRKGFEIRLFNLAFERRIPILGICQGCQVINLALGGSLIQDMLTAFPHSPVAHRRRIFPYYVPHSVTVEPASLLEGIVGEGRIETNSAHHQSVNRLGEGLRIAARADDGIVEAVEWVADERFLLGIQWHPEVLAANADGPHRALFRALVRAARGRLEAGGLRLEA